ncbi:hypothetical protein PG984_016230 [Apiospora sp. TS-2023a]
MVPLLTLALKRKKLHTVKLDWLEDSLMQARKLAEKHYMLASGGRSIEESLKAKTEKKKKKAARDDELGKVYPHPNCGAMQASHQEREERDPVPLRWNAARRPPDESARGEPAVSQGLQATLPEEDLRARVTLGAVRAEHLLLPYRRHPLPIRSEYSTGSESDAPLPSIETDEVKAWTYEDMPKEVATRLHAAHQEREKHHPLVHSGGIVWTERIHPKIRHYPEYHEHESDKRGYLALHGKVEGKFAVPLDSNSLRRFYCLDCRENSTSSHRGIKNKHKDISSHISKHRADVAYQRDEARDQDYEWRCACSFKAQ